MMIEGYLMEFLEFKLPKEIGKRLSPDHFLSYIITDDKGLRVAFCKEPDFSYDVVFDFGHSMEDYRVSDEGRRLDHHMMKTPERWLFIEVKNSEYLKKLDKESQGVLLGINPDLKHYMTGDIDYSIDIISRAEPEVYKVKREKKNDS